MSESAPPLILYRPMGLTFVSGTSLNWVVLELFDSLKYVILLIMSFSELCHSPDFVVLQNRSPNDVILLIMSFS